MTELKPTAEDLKAAAQYYNDNRDYHDSDGVDSAKCFMDGILHERAKTTGDDERKYPGSFAEFWTHRNSVKIPWNELKSEEAKAFRVWTLAVSRGLAIHRDEMEVKGMVPASEVKHRISEEVKAKDAEIERLKNLLECFLDGDPCSFDHKGGCQAHGFIFLQPGDTCPQAEAKAILTPPTEGEIE